MVIYKKSTKENTNIPVIILFFLKELANKIIDRGGLKLDGEMTFVVKSKDIKYCYDAIRMVEKTFRRKNMICKMTSYINNTDTKEHMYVWKFRMGDNLPF